VKRDRKTEEIRGKLRDEVPCSGTGERTSGRSREDAMVRPIKIRRRRYSIVAEDDSLMIVLPRRGCRGRSALICGKLKIQAHFIVHFIKKEAEYRTRLIK